MCDDDEGIVDVAGIVLRDAGYDVTTVTVSEQIFSVINNVKPDIILLDLWMPNLSGEKIAEQLKQQKKTKDIPVIIMSASRKTEQTARRAGADDFICKPFDIEELEEIVRKYTA
ncbi:response regulator [Candidatus Roizmanbacteria bacterium]|nr:MAG: response regulator [Candidatus Roizmanbacteria bacterium]